MCDLARLHFIASRLAKPDFTNMLVEVGDAAWQLDEHTKNLRYKLVSEHPLILAELASEIDWTPSLLKDVEIELLELQSGCCLKPHYHARSESVVVCPTVVHPYQKGYFRFSVGEGSWYHLLSGEIISIPSATVHGFINDHAIYSMYLLAISSPPIGGNDTLYP